VDNRWSVECDVDLLVVVVVVVDEVVATVVVVSGSAVQNDQTSITPQYTSTALGPNNYKC